jgi:hypothetical protein
VRGILREIPDTWGNIKKMSRLAGYPENGVAMPARKVSLPDENRAKRIRDTARNAETDNDPASFERAFARVVTTSAKSEEAMVTKETDDQFVERMKKTPVSPGMEGDVKRLKEIEKRRRTSRILSPTPPKAPQN